MSSQIQIQKPSNFVTNIVFISGGITEIPFCVRGKSAGIGG
jgi:hypothetical protein